MRIGLFDRFAEDQASFTRYQPLPPGFEWVRGAHSGVDAVLATQGNWNEIIGSSHPVKIYWEQETAEAWKHNGPYDQFQLVLTNDKALLDRLPNARYMTLFGSQVVVGRKRSTPKESWYTRQASEPEPPFIAAPPEKTKGISLLASNLVGLSGHRLRPQVAKKVPGIDIYGTVLSGNWTYPENAYLPYRFNVAIENANYPWWHTEKVFNCFASKTVPIYWGGQGDFSKLKEWGFAPEGIIPWDGNLEWLKNTITYLPDGIYEESDKAVEHNYYRQQELYCVESALMELFKKEGIA